ncbi:hypothetical protein ACWD6R_29735 [Streptomyces sp. NPDC005151]
MHSTGEATTPSVELSATGSSSARPEVVLLGGGLLVLAVGLDIYQRWAPTVLLALWWLLAQLRRHRPGHMTVGGTHPAAPCRLRLTDDSFLVAMERSRLIPGVAAASPAVRGRG